MLIVPSEGMSLVANRCTTKSAPCRGGQHAHERSVENLPSVSSTPTLANTPRLRRQRRRVRLGRRRGGRARLRGRRGRERLLSRGLALRGLEHRARRLRDRLRPRRPPDPAAGRDHALRAVGKSRDPGRRCTHDDLRARSRDLRRCSHQGSPAPDQRRRNPVAARRRHSQHWCRTRSSSGSRPSSHELEQQVATLHTLPITVRYANARPITGRAFLMLARLG